MGHSRPLFLYFCLLNTVDCKCSLKFLADDWIWTMDLWNWKWPLYQLCRNHCPHVYVFSFPIWHFSQRTNLATMNLTRRFSAPSLFNHFNLAAEWLRDSRSGWCNKCHLQKTFRTIIYYLLKESSNYQMSLANFSVTTLWLK